MLKQELYKQMFKCTCVLSLLIALSLVVSCGSQDREILTANDSVSPEALVIVHASLPYTFRDIQELSDYTDLIVKGKVTHLYSTRMKGRIPLTQFDLQIEEVIFTRDKDVPEKITLEETGGTVNGVTYVTEVQPLIKVGQQVILFLRKTTKSTCCQYFIFSPQGVYVLDKTRVKPLETNSVQILIDSEGMNVASFDALMSATTKHLSGERRIWPPNEQPKNQGNGVQ